MFNLFADLIFFHLKLIDQIALTEEHFLERAL